MWKKWEDNILSHGDIRTMITRADLGRTSKDKKEIRKKCQEENLILSHGDIRTMIFLPIKFIVYSHEGAYVSTYIR